jgi:hypothetical protein
LGNNKLKTIPLSARSEDISCKFNTGEPSATVHRQHQNHMGMHTILKLIQKNPEETARAYCVNDNADIFYPSAQTFKDSGSFHRSTLNPAQVQVRFSCSLTR